MLVKPVGRTFRIQPVKRLLGIAGYLCLIAHFQTVLEQPVGEFLKFIQADRLELLVAFLSSEAPEQEGFGCAVYSTVSLVGGVPLSPIR